MEWQQTLERTHSTQVDIKYLTLFACFVCGVLMCKHLRRENVLKRLTKVTATIYVLKNLVGIFIWTYYFTFGKHELDRKVQVNFKLYKWKKFSGIKFILKNFLRHSKSRSISWRLWFKYFVNYIKWLRFFFISLSFQTQVASRNDKNSFFLLKWRLLPVFTFAKHIKIPEFVFDPKIKQDLIAFNISSFASRVRNSQRLLIVPTSC